MAEDAWPDEPDEPDPEPDPERDVNPEERWDDPEEELPPDPQSLKDVDVHPKVSRTFWAAVIAANVALAGLAVGPMIIFFEGLWTLGGIFMLVGLLALFRVYQHYRAFQQLDVGDEDGGGDGDTEESESDAARNA